MPYHPVRLSVVTLLAACLAVPTGAVLPPRTVCDVDVVPAATLLVPYFEVDLTATSLTRTTLVAVTNASTLPRVVHVTLWTDWAIPTASFDLVLGPNDVQTFDVKQLFTVGPPVTQPTAPSCSGRLAAGQMHLNPGIPPGTTVAEGLANLRKAHTGEAFSIGTAEFLASSLHAGAAVGYLTLDAANRCSDGFPSTANYFKAGGTGVASNVNALVGDVIYVDSESGRGEAVSAVHIRTSSAFRSGDYTFYGTYVNRTAIDGRQPLGNTYGSRYFVDFPPDPDVAPATDLLVWRDLKTTNSSPVLAGSQPYWVPLLKTPAMYAFDEAAHRTVVRHHLGLATQRVAVGADGIVTPYGAGWLRINLNHVVPSRQGGPVFYSSWAQGWITTLQRANLNSNPASGGWRAFRLTTPCVTR